MINTILLPFNRISNFSIKVLCRKILNMNDTNIGKEFGKDRTTVGHNIEKIEESIDTNSTIKSDVNYILKDLNYNEG